MKLNVFDAFSGCGGLSLGLEQAGFKVLWANENWGPAAETYRKNHNSTQVFETDAQELMKSFLNNDNQLPHPGDVDLLVGGPPCQGFSSYNIYSKPDDPRNSLVETFFDFANYLKPRYVLMENVPGMLSMDDGKVIKNIFKTFNEIGYDVRLNILQAGYYGLPQNRWRVFIFCAKRGLTIPNYPEPECSFIRTTIFGATKFKENVIKAPNESNLFWDLKPMTTVGDAIKDLPLIVNGNNNELFQYQTSQSTNYQKLMKGKCKRIYDHVCANKGPKIMERIQLIPKKKKAGWHDLPDHLKPKNLVRTGSKGYENRFGRLYWDGIFNTILTEANPYWGRVIHPEQDRVISVRESARAQGIPDKIHFSGRISDKYKQVGNAVPPPLSKAIGKEIIKAYHADSSRKN